MSQEIANPVNWAGLDRDRRKFRALIFPGLLSNLLGHDMLGQMDAVVTSDHLAFYDDKNAQGVIRVDP